MKTIQKENAARFLAASLLTVATFSAEALAQPTPVVPAGQTVLTFINRLVIDPPQVQVFGYFPTIEGLPGPLFAGTPGEASAYFTWSLDAAGAVQIGNSGVNPAGSLMAAVLPSGHSLKIYYNANPNQNWNTPASFSAGQLVATLQATTGTQVGSGPVSLVTQSYTLVSSSNFSFKGQTYNFARLVPHGFTSIGFGGNIPIDNTDPPQFPYIFTAAGSAIAIGGQLSALPRGE